MSRIVSPRSSRPVAIWLVVVAALVFLMVIVGGATRLTDSGLSITEWRPVTGSVPPLSAEAWAEEFAKYRTIPQYQEVNRGMSLDEFKAIYWWEWIHRFLGRLIGLAFALPFAWFLIRRQIPRRLIVPGAILLVLGGLQGAIGWWMVSSGLVDRVDVLPERLTIHLGMALLILVGLIWTALDALNDGERVRPPMGWSIAGFALLGAVFFQALLGGLVAGNDAGRLYTDWPMMGGRFVPPFDLGAGLWRALLHDPALVQFNHRIGAYLLLIGATAMAGKAFVDRMPDGVRIGAAVTAGLIWLQAIAGVITVLNASPLGLGMVHQTGALLCLMAATWVAWRIRHAETHQFSRGLLRN